MSATITFLTRPCEKRSAPRANPVEPKGATPQLLCDLAVPHDRACDELREQRHVEGEVARPLDGFRTPERHVDHVAHRLEREEGNPDRQRDLRPLDHPRRSQDRGPRCVQLVDEEVRVLEPAQDGEVQHHRARDAESLRPRVARVGSPTPHSAQPPVPCDGEPEDEYELARAPGIEDEAAHKEQEVAPPTRHEGVREENDGDEIEEKRL